MRRPAGAGRAAAAWPGSVQSRPGWVAAAIHAKRVPSAALTGAHWGVTTWAYARLERERRFLLERGPEAADGDHVLDIEDRYLDGTRLRLRVVRRDGQAVYKLGQKIRVDPAQPSAVAHTTLYLDREEYEALRRLRARTLTKTRTLHAWHGLTLAVDVFAGDLEGLVLAEIDLGDPPGELPTTAALPSPNEVTEDERFTGGALAGTSREQLRNLLGAGPARGGRRADTTRVPGPLDSDRERPRPAVPVRLEPVSADNVRDVCALRVAVGQERFVTANAVSLAEAQFYPAAWVRAAYAGEDPVGFVMVHDSADGPGYMLWRLMIDNRFQGRGYGRQVVHLVQEHLRSRPAARTLRVGARGGSAGPAAFYLSLGFTATGERVDDDEEILTREL